MGAGVLATGSAGAVAWLGSGAAADELTIDAALARIELLANQPIATSGDWNAFQVLTHCAQSVEYSMRGYPAPRSALFQHTAGRLAFLAFASQKKMKHALSDPIPGAPALARSGDVGQAIDRLRQAFIDFQQFDGQLAPHFAYGPLGWDDYALAHALHFSNHLEEIVTAPKTRT